VLHDIAESNRANWNQVPGESASYFASGGSTLAADEPAAGIPVDFSRADMMDLPASLTGFDLIYLNWGAICWVPDLTVFATLIADSRRIDPPRRTSPGLESSPCRARIT
jgi:hypothetical protein